MPCERGTARSFEVGNETAFRDALGCANSGSKVTIDLVSSVDFNDLDSTKDSHALWVQPGAKLKVRRKGPSVGPYVLRPLKEAGVFYVGGGISSGQGLSGPTELTLDGKSSLSHVRGAEGVLTPPFLDRRRNRRRQGTHLRRRNSERGLWNLCKGSLS